MSSVNFYKVDSLPVTTAPNSFYYVLSGNYAEVYLTDIAGVPKKVGNTQMIEELSKNINAGFFT